MRLGGGHLWNAMTYARDEARGDLKVPSLLGEFVGDRFAGKRACGP